MEKTKKRLLMIDLVTAFLVELEDQEIEPAICMLLGRPFPKWSQRTLKVSWATLSEIIKHITGIEWNVFTEAFSKTGDIGSATKTVFESSKAKRQTMLFERTMTLMEVRRSFEALADASGLGSREKKERLIEGLLGSASPLEAKYLVKIFVGEMRSGFHEGLMEQAVSKAFQIPLEMVQKASMIEGDIGKVAAIAKIEGMTGVSKVRFKVFKPVSLMLAQNAADVAEAFREHGGRTAFEYKYDGARVQIHKLGYGVKIFSRRLTEVTESLPEIVEQVKVNVKSKEVILEGEVIAVDKRGYPIPFQYLMRRFRRVLAIEETAKEIPLRLFLFDILYLNGENLNPIPYTRRRQILSDNVGKIPLAAQYVTDKSEEAERFLKEAMSAGHEGLMAKKLDSPYTLGIRGKRWLKIKPVLEPLDLVIVAAEYGYGRRIQWLSDYYLAARDVETDELLAVGKTFKGLTDAEITEMTKKLSELALGREPGRLTVIPEVVVEVVYNEIQKSPKYKSGMALRFARISRIREDKTVKEADTIQKVREIYEKQFLKKGRYSTE